LGWFWYQRGYLCEGKELLEKALALPTENRAATARLDALYTYAWILNSSGQTAAAALCYQEMATLARANDDPSHLADALNGLGLAAFHDDYEAARGYLEQSLAVNHSLPEGGRSLANLNNLCYLAMAVGDVETADRYGEMTASLAREQGKKEN